jgi:spore germination protein GerM
MAKRKNNFPVRIVVIAGVIVIALGALLVMINRLGRPAEAPASTGVVAPGEEIAVAPEDAAATGNIQPVMTVQLYVADASGRQLITRIVRIDEPPTPALQVEAALLQLAAAPSSPMPLDVVIREIWVANGVAYLDFSADLPASLDGGSRSELMFVYGVVGTLTASVPSVAAVQFLVAGRPVDTLTGHTDLSVPVTPLADWSF